jgi:prepilin-type N-terminal cleavage/methylation domain-containing protein
MNKKNAFRRGFTLIELMIVIVILGILMGTILPRLTGAQARARDTARKADLTNISQALEVYYGDTGSYPMTPTNGTAIGCLDVKIDTTSDADGPNQPGTKNTTAVLAEYMKGGKVPLAISSQQDTLGCVGSYFYKPLFSGGIGNASYVLASDVETWQLANYIAGDGSTQPDATVFDSTGTSAKSYINQMTKLPADTAITTASIFIVIP